jgi:hypothetical protein
MAPFLTLHSGVTRQKVRENTPWDVGFADRFRDTPAPTARELPVLRNLYVRTDQAHGVPAVEA